MNQKISVVIPTYNRADKLSRSIESVLHQTYGDLELIIVDDGSEDDTEMTVKAIQDNRIRYIKLPTNQGASAARNEGVRQSNYDLVAFQDSDDIWMPEKLEKQMAYWREYPDFSMIYCAFISYLTVNETLVGEERIPHADRKKAEGRILPELLVQNFIGTPTVLVNKAKFIETGGFDITLRSLEDWDFVVRFSEKYEIGYVNEVLVNAYLADGGVSLGKGSFSAYYESRCKMIAKYRKQMIGEGIFDRALLELFQRAEKRGILEQVKRMLVLLLEKQKDLYEG